MGIQTMRKNLDLISLNQELLQHMRHDEFAGYDPFDFLNSRLFQSLAISKVEFFRLAWLQFGKHSPINFRPLVRVPQKRNPKGIALFILGMLEDYHRTGNDTYLKEASILGDWLIANSSDIEHWGGYCWGYHFDWQARAFFVPAGKPNIITTCYVARALHDLGKKIDNQKFFDASLDSANFISKQLFTEKDDRKFYAYIPGESAFVHNASLWGASWCAQVGRFLGNTSLKDQSLCVAYQSVNEQRHDGSWVYGARSHHNFIDGFHTGYNLEALDLLRNSLKTQEFDNCISKGYEYYLKTFIQDDGTVKYYDNSVYPLDMHCFSQAILTILKISRNPSDYDLCKKVASKGVQLLYMRDKGRFAYQRNRLITNKVNYSRWTQAWSYFSFAYYNRIMSDQNL